jgi:hypothetical protein
MSRVIRADPAETRYYYGPDLTKIPAAIEGYEKMMADETGNPEAISRAYRNFLKEVVIVDIRVVCAKIDRTGHTLDAIAVLYLIATARGATEIPLVHIGILLAQPFIDEAGEWGRRRRRDVWNAIRSWRWGE